MATYNRQIPGGPALQDAEEAATYNRQLPGYGAVQESNVASGGGATLTADKGDLTLTGRVALFSTALSAAKGNLTLTGQSAALNPRLIASKGDLTLAGRDATLSATGSVTLAADKGDLTLIGRAALLNLALTATKGDLTLSGKTALLNTALTASKGTLTLTGQDATLSATAGSVTLDGGKGDLTLTGGDASLSATALGGTQAAGGGFHQHPISDPRHPYWRNRIELEEPPPTPDLPAPRVEWADRRAPKVTPRPQPARALTKRPDGTAVVQALLGVPAPAAPYKPGSWTEPDPTTPLATGDRYHEEHRFIEELLLLELID